MRLRGIGPRLGKALIWTGIVMLVTAVYVAFASAIAALF